MENAYVHYYSDTCFKCTLARKIIKIFIGFTLYFGLDDTFENENVFLFHYN